MKNTKRIIATVLTAVMMISMLPSSVFAAELDAYDVVEPAVEAVSVPAEEQEIESTVEDISVEDAEEVQGSSEEIETVDAADPEAADVIEDTEAPVVTEEKTTIEAEGKDYVVTVTYDASALLPDDVKVSVEEIFESAKKYDDYCNQALEAVQQENADVEELSYTRLFDIKLVDADGNPLEPASAVDVQIRLKDVETVEENTQIVHFAGEEETPEVIEPTVENDTVAFATEGFSVYAVVGTDNYERLTVNFYGAKDSNTGEYTLIETMYVKKKDLSDDAQLAKVLYDPGAGTIPRGYSFYGWSIDSADYSAEDAPGSDIEQVRTYIKEEKSNFVEGDVLNVYAMLFKHYTVNYFDIKNVNIGSDTALVKEDGEQVSYTVKMSYTTDSTHDFQGWMPVEGSGNIIDPSEATPTTVIPNETEITITGDVTFSVNAPEGHWLIFDENGKHATYNAPRFVKDGEVTSDENLLEMKRNGYEFVDWYTGAPSSEGGEPTGEPFVFGNTLTDTTTIYAKWEIAEKANYTVIIWLESLTENEYDFKEAIPLEGDVNTIANPVTVVNQTSDDERDRYARINGEDYQYKGFSLYQYDQNVTINPEGNAVVNVRYKRNTYKLTFNSYWLDGGSMSISARYGENIGSNFPIGKNETYSYYTEQLRWKPTNHPEIFDHVLVYIDTMPYADVNFDGDSSYATVKYMYYYTEALPEEASDIQVDGMRFKLYRGPISAKFNYFTFKEDFIELNGYERYKSDPAMEMTDDGQVDPDNGRIYFYYTRKYETINYMDGSYFDGNGNYLEEASKGQLHEDKTNVYGSDLTSYNDNGYTPEDQKEYVFAGWYADERCTIPYEFTTMPFGGITVYAKWIQREYRVFLRPNAGQDASLDWGSENQKTNFRVAYGEKISAPDGKRIGYNFYGWHADAELTTPVYTPGLVLNETTVFDEYDKTLKENMTDPNNKWGNANGTSNADVDRFWITKRFELFAKWGRIIEGAEGIGIVYDVDTEEGSNPPSDTILHQDNTSAVAGAAPTANQGKVFNKWVVQKWNGEKFEDTSVEVLPGKTFTVHVEDARIKDTDNNTYVSLDDVTKNGHYEYVVQLRAVFSDIVEAPTHINWYSNYEPSTTYREDVGLKINQAVMIYGLDNDESIPTREGYKFIGWAKDNEYAEGAEEPNTSTEKTKADFLEYKEGKYFVAGTETEVTQVAADEVEPYEALYAIWQYRPHFTIYHSSDGTEEVIYMDEDGYAEPYDLTRHVKSDFIYGGYYHYEDNEKDAPYRDEPGTAMIPVQDTTYYLKEVPNAYLKTSAYITWRTATPSVLRSMWFMTAIDAEEYSEVGFIVGEEDVKADLGEKLDIRNAKGEVTESKTAYTLTGRDDEPDAAIAVFNAKSYLTAETIGQGIEVTAYYVTPDSVKVTGVQTKSFKSEDRTKTKLSVGVKESAYTPTAKAAASSRMLSARKKLTLNDTPETVSLTVTKVDNGKKVAQTVKEGDNTGKITWAGKTNYVFAGWYEDASYSKAADFSNVKQDMTVYAKYVKASTVKLSFAKKAVKAGEVTLKATLKISNQPDIADTAVECTYKDNAYAVEFTGVKKSSAMDTYTGTVKISGLENNSAFTAVISYKTPDGTIVNTSSRTCTYKAGTVTVK